MKAKWLYILTLFLFIGLLTERVTIQGAIVSVVLTAVIVVAGYVTGDSVHTPFQWAKLAVLWGAFVTTLFWEVALANIQVAVIVLSPSMNIQPHVLQWETNLSNDGLQTVLANAITLTPGTMSVDLEGKTLSIHCLTDQAAADLQNNTLEKRLLRIQEVLHE